MIKNAFKYVKFLFIFISIVLLSFCARKTHFLPGETQVGLASWYGDDFHGKTTSNKEIYNMYDFTAAHKSLPFNTFVRVINLKNGKEVTVRINDRGPFIKGRIIDLSYAAARRLDMIGPGVVPVKVEILKYISPKKSSQKFLVLVGSFIVKDNAEILKNNLSKKYKNVLISLHKTPAQTYHRVIIKAKSLKDAEAISQRLHKEGYSALVMEER